MGQPKHDFAESLKEHRATVRQFNARMSILQRTETSLIDRSRAALNQSWQILSAAPPLSPRIGDNRRKF
jgi:hypothetical protein